MARPERFELPAPKFVAWCSIQLSYGRVGPRIIWKGFRSVNRAGGNDGRYATERKAIPWLASARCARHRDRRARDHQRDRRLSRLEIAPTSALRGSVDWLTRWPVRAPVRPDRPRDRARPTRRCRPPTDALG